MSLFYTAIVVTESDMAHRANSSHKRHMERALIEGSQRRGSPRSVLGVANCLRASPPLRRPEVTTFPAASCLCASSSRARSRTTSHCPARVARSSAIASASSAVRGTPSSSLAGPSKWLHEVAACVSSGGRGVAKPRGIGVVRTFRIEAHSLGSAAERRGGSSPFPCTFRHLRPSEVLRDAACLRDGAFLQPRCRRSRGSKVAGAGSAAMGAHGAVRVARAARLGYDP